jgi:hypothetical protein
MGKKKWLCPLTELQSCVVGASAIGRVMAQSKVGSIATSQVPPHQIKTKKNIAAINT